MHDFIPIFSCDDTEQDRYCFPGCREVGVPAMRRGHSFTCSVQGPEAADRVGVILPVDVLSVFDSSKENDAGKRVTEEEEEHPHDDEEALVHAHDHGQQQHLQRDLQTSHKSGACFRVTIYLCGFPPPPHKCTHVFPAYCEESEDNHTSAHHVGVCVLHEGNKREKVNSSTQRLIHSFGGNDITWFGADQ